MSNQQNTPMLNYTLTTGDKTKTITSQQSILSIDDNRIALCFKDDALIILDEFFRSIGFTMRFGTQKTTKIRSPVSKRMITIPTSPKKLSALKRRTMAQLHKKKQSSKFTDEQMAAINGVVSGTGHVSIKALAGTGKTHTLVECANRLDPTLSVAAVAYNRSIADELKTRMPAHVDCVTAHSLGKQLLPGATVNNQKVARILREKLHMSTFTVKKVSELVSKMKMGFDAKDANTRFKIEATPEQIKTAEKALQISDCDRTTIDFDDMIRLSCKINNPKYDVIFVDEAQDLSAIRRRLIINTLKPNGRIVYVGDPNQAIYGFSGADSRSMINFAKELGGNVTEYTLTKTFRCAKAIVNHANELIPSLNLVTSNAQTGSVETSSEHEFKPGDMVLCRSNASLEIKTRHLLENGIPAFMLGRRITTRHDDQEIFDLETWSVANPTKSVSLMTIHKSKGLEADNVVIIDPLALQKEGQELNLWYVAVTRARKKLIYLEG